MLLEHLLYELGAAERPEAAALRTRGFLAELAHHTWPGNVRELRNYIERCITLRELAPPAAVAPGPDTPVIDAAKPFKLARDQWAQFFERRYLEEVLHFEQPRARRRARVRRGSAHPLESSTGQPLRWAPLLRRSSDGSDDPARS